jgi:tetratricopeptide (TPR) repeat protein
LIVKDLQIQDLDKTLARDYSEFIITIQSMLQRGKRIPPKYFIPSLILKDVIMMYDQGKYKRVVDICEELLLETRNYDEQILWQTRYWLTSALSKMKDRKALDYLRFFKDNTVVYNFLRGFYYRNIGERNEAMVCYDKVLKVDPKHQRSKREKVNILLSWGKYEDAYELAKENYENDKNNIYHIHSYFITLVRRQEYLTREEIILLEDLIADMDSRGDHKAEDMVRCMKGEFAYYVKNDLNRARLLLLEAVQLNENKNYPKKSLWEVYKAAKLLHEFGQLGLTGANEGYNVEDYE